jgi:hypothetical protein
MPESNSQSRQEELAALFREVGAAHHRAFATTNGDDPDWPTWYAEHLVPRRLKPGIAKSGGTVPPNMMVLIAIVALAGIAGSTIAQIVKAIAGRGASSAELASIKQQLDQCVAALEDAQTTLATQAHEVAELHERLDFAERLLTQARDRSAT